MKPNVFLYQCNYCNTHTLNNKENDCMMCGLSRIHDPERIDVPFNKALMTIKLEPKGMAKMERLLYEVFTFVDKNSLYKENLDNFGLVSTIVNILDKESVHDDLGRLDSWVVVSSSVDIGYGDIHQTRVVTEKGEFKGKFYDYRFAYFPKSTMKTKWRRRDRAVELLYNIVNLELDKVLRNWGHSDIDDRHRVEMFYKLVWSLRVIPYSKFVSF